jgi:hypothetical protein
MESAMVALKGIGDLAGSQKHFRDVLRGGGWRDSNTGHLAASTQAYP